MVKIFLTDGAPQLRNSVMSYYNCRFSMFDRIDFVAYLPPWDCARVKIDAVKLFGKEASSEEL